MFQLVSSSFRHRFAAAAADRRGLDRLARGFPISADQQVFFSYTIHGVSNKTHAGDDQRTTTDEWINTWDFSFCTCSHFTSFARVLRFHRPAAVFHLTVSFWNTYILNGWQRGATFPQIDKGIESTTFASFGKSPCVCSFSLGQTSSHNKYKCKVAQMSGLIQLASDRPKRAPLGICRFTISSSSLVLVLLPLLYRLREKKLKWDFERFIFPAFRITDGGGHQRAVW